MLLNLNIKKLMLKTYLRLAHRMQKTTEQELVKLVDNFFNRANNRRKEVKLIITFQEFRSLLLNSSL